MKRSALSAPTPIAPARGATVQALPTFGWRGVGGADHRAVSKSGGVSAWSAPRAIRKEWTSVPILLSPSSRAEIVFPSTPLVLRWLILLAVNY